MWGVILQVLRFAPVSIRYGFALGFLLLLLLAMAVAIVNFAAGDDPFLRLPARYANLVLLCVAALVPLAFILFLALVLIVRRSFD